MITYELWDLDLGNRVGEFDSEAEAVAALRAIWAENGDGFVRSLSILRIDADEAPMLVLDGSDFLASATSRISPVA